MRSLTLERGFRMPSHRRFAPAAVRVTVVGSLVAAVALSATGCAGLPGSPVSVALSEGPGFPRNAPISEPLFDNNWRGEPVGWLDDNRETITVVSYGSSTCPLVATAITVIDDSTVAIDLRQAPAQACTDDLAPYTHVLAVPAGWGQGEGPYAATFDRALDAFGPTGSIQTTAQLWPWPEPTSIAVQTLSGLPDDITIPSDALEKGAPLAFWGMDRASLRVITWGSSSCPPPALSLDLVSSTELALVFGALPPRACTADFAPTTHVFGVPEGLDLGTVFLTITIELGEAPSLQYRVPIAQ
ncbi:MAG: hypothetical protein C0444_02995 [Microbacterium sp.]|nr:hypothetical protein [Microbacterium sp.]MBA4345660.1 hypothetical protein [Microbacterium sp.]